MAGYTQINLSNLPAPAVIETLDFEAILQDMRDDLVERLPEIEGVIDLESEPARKLLEVFAFRETLLRARINDAARAVMMAYAMGTDLDHIGALFGVERMLITPANPATIPPTAAIYETDDEFRRRVQIALEGFSVAGPSGAYIFHALSADPRVKDASAISPEPGAVLVTVMGRTGTGTVGLDVLTAVDEALNDEDVRPLCDSVVVQSATVINYEIEATIYVATGPDAATVIAASQTAVEAYVSAQHMLGRPVTISGIHAALHGPGVINVDLVQPAANIDVDPTETAYCTGITLTDGGIP